MLEGRISEELWICYETGETVQTLPFPGHNHDGWSYFGPRSAKPQMFWSHRDDCPGCVAHKLRKGAEGNLIGPTMEHIVRCR